MLDLPDIRKRLNNIKLSDAARDLNVTVSYLSFIKNGHRTNPSYEMIKKLSDYLLITNDK